jgi:hypothetical protein
MGLIRLFDLDDINVTFDVVPTRHYGLKGRRRDFSRRFS